MSEYRLGSYGTIMKGERDFCQYDETYKMIAELNKLETQLKASQDELNTNRKIRYRLEQEVSRLRECNEAYVVFCNSLFFDIPHGDPRLSKLKAKLTNNQASKLKGE